MTPRTALPAGTQGLAPKPGLAPPSRPPRGRRPRVVALLGGLLVAAAALTLPVASASRPQAVGWIIADTYAREDSRPTLYWPGNLLDGSNSTVWCAEGGPHVVRGQTIRVGFKGSVEVDRVTITTGDGRSAAQFAESNRVTRVVINDGRYRRTVNLADQRGAQIFQLSPPVRGHQVQITIEDVEGEEALTCLTGLVFRTKEGRNLNGAWMGRSLKFDRERSPLLGVWAGGMLAAPERFLTLYLDGTYRYVSRPHDPAIDPFDRSGSYRISEGRLQFRIDGKWVSVNVERVSGRDDFGETHQRIELTEPDEELQDMEGTWHAWQR